MNNVELSGWACDYEENSKKIYQVANQIKSVNKDLTNSEVLVERFKMLFQNITNVLNNWTGNTYVGQKKNKTIEKAFQSFFLELHSLLLKLNEIKEPEIQSFVKKALYQGTLYRYLGYGYAKGDTKKKIEPVYNTIFVSWSKNSYNSYIESKLYGTLTLLSCNVSGNYYGIDLTAFGISRGDEEEVVFPTIEETIVGIEYK